MHDVLRQRLLRRIESLPEAQVYQVLDFVEFLESKYARNARVEPTVLQKFAEGVEDKLRKQAMNPATLREAFQLIAAADRVLADVSSAGKQILGELSDATGPRKELPRTRDSNAGTPESRGGTGTHEGRSTGSRSREKGGEVGRTRPARDPDPTGDGEPGS